MYFAFLSFCTSKSIMRNLRRKEIFNCIHDSFSRNNLRLRYDETESRQEHQENLPSVLEPGFCSVSKVSQRH